MGFIFTTAFSATLPDSLKHVKTFRHEPLPPTVISSGKTIINGYITGYNPESKCSVEMLFKPFLKY